VGDVAHLGERRNAYSFWWGNLKERDRWEDVDIDGDYFKIGRKAREWESLDFKILAQDRESWQAVVNTAMNIIVQ
jgi:hypothetical protein